jgi:hypothetical protein
MIVGTPEKGRRIGVGEGYGSVNVRKDDNKAAITTAEMRGNLKENDNVIASATGLKRLADGTTGISPGNRGKDTGSWCQYLLRDGPPFCWQISPAPLAGVMTGPVNMKSGAERQSAN